MSRALSGLIFFFCCAVSLLLPGLSLAAAGATSIAGHRLLTVGRLSAAENCVLGYRFRQLWCAGLVAPANVESFPPGIEPTFPSLAGGFLSTVLLGSPGVML